MADAQATSRIDEALIEEIVRRVLSLARPDKIVLFGSVVAGRMTPDSDRDLLVVEARPIPSRRRAERLRHCLASRQRPETA